MEKFKIENGVLVRYYGNSENYNDYDDEVVTIPNSVTTIGDNAFSCSSLKEVTIPNSVTTIGSWAFSDCSSLKEITIPNSVTSIGNRAFKDCSSLKEITIPNSVTSIGSYAFYSCSNLKEVTIPDSVTSIGEKAFSYCSSLKEITIPDSVTFIGYEAFSDCSSLKEVTVNDNNKNFTDINGVLFNKSKTELICYPDGKEDISYNIHDSVTTIGEGAFSYCSSLKEVTIPNSVTTIGKGAFYSCSSLKKVTIPNNVTTIGIWAFHSCRSLKEVTIPNGVTSIGERAFYFCENLENVTIPDSVTTIGEGAFSYCSSLKEITIPNGVTSIGEDTFYKCSSLEKVTIPNSVTHINDKAFYNGNIDLLIKVEKWYRNTIKKSLDFDNELFNSLSQECRNILENSNYTIEFGGPFRACNVGLPFLKPSLWEIFKTSTTPKVIFERIYDLLLYEEYYYDEDEEDDIPVKKIYAKFEGNCLYEYIDYLNYCDEEENYNIYDSKIDMIDNAIEENSDWIPDFVTDYGYHLIPNECDDYDDKYRGIDSVEGDCTINLIKYAKSHSELYMFQLEILSAFIGKLGTAQETDTIIETILDTTEILADNHAEDCISKLLTDDIYKNLWFDDNIKTKVSKLIK